MSSFPPDHLVRTRFAQETDRNFSLICPAGSGKTHSLTSRAGALASRSDASKVLPSLVVVTYTRKAAEEMQQRARAALVSQGVQSSVQHAFNQSFYGTIHSFAVELLRTYGHHIGVPSVFEVIEDDTPLWEQFLYSPELEAVLSVPRSRRLVRHVNVSDVFNLARAWDFARPAAKPVGELPAVTFPEVHAFPSPKRADTAENIRKAKEEFARFQEVSATAGEGFVPFPRPSKGGKEFLAVCRLASQPIQKWIAASTAEVSGAIAHAFRAYRISKGALGYDDQTQLAVELVRHPKAAREIRARNFRILLDEAQDTDPSQFEFLLEAVRPIDATDHWSHGSHPPAPGRFVMVGDPEQSIYSSRADIQTYLRVHAYLSQAHIGEALGFDVTFRCAHAIIGFTNGIFPEILHGQRGQVAFVPLQAKPSAAQGQVLRLSVPETPCENDLHRAGAEAEFLAKALASAGLSGLRARSWGQVAILCPRKRWFPALRDALMRQGIESQLLSTRVCNADSPAYAWFTAVAYALTSPNDSYELAGVLREVFGVSDRDLALFTHGDGSRLNLNAAPDGDTQVERALATLMALRAECMTQPVRAQAQLIADLLTPRLDTLPLDSATVRGDFDRLLLAATLAETEGASLHDFTETLLGDWNVVPDEPEDPSRLSIITNLKSKGLEWDCVVVPYLFREISEPPPSYPRLIGRRSTSPQVIFNRDEMPPEEGAAEDMLKLQELERLLYVSCTRPRHTLVLVDDRVLFGTSGTPTLCGANALRITEENRSVFDQLPEVATPDEHLTADIGIRGPVAAPLESTLNLESAREAAGQFSKLVRPSQMNSAVVATEDPELRGETSGSSLDYGVWWHEFVRNIRWDEGCESWVAGFEGECLQSPDPVRARREWKLFLASDLAAILEQKGTLVLAESPCLVPVDGQFTVDGIIDLAILNEPKSGWLLVDWKSTNSSDAEAYRPQLSTYAAAIKAATGLPSEIAVYFTGTGKLVRLG